MTIDDRIREALRRLFKNIDRRHQVALGRPQKTANRSVGQLYKRKEPQHGNASQG